MLSHAAGTLEFLILLRFVSAKPNGGNATPGKRHGYIQKRKGYGMASLPEMARLYKGGKGRNPFGGVPFAFFAYAKSKSAFNTAYFYNFVKCVALT